MFSSVAANNSREKILGLKIREALVNYHYRKLDINDDLSKRAFKEFIKKFDYGKQFFLQSDIKKLERFEKLADENESLWQFLDEQKEMEQALKLDGDEYQEEFSEILIRRMKPWGDA